MAKIKVTAQTQFVGSRATRFVTVDDEDLDGMDAQQRTDHLEECAREELWNIIEWGWEEVDG